MSLTETSELVFPAVRPEPGVFRHTWWTHDAPGAIYVGESHSLQRRMRNYRRPGPTQATSKRVHSLLVEHLSAGGAVDLEVLDVDVLQVGGTDVPVDLRLKAHPVLLEHAALAVVLAGGTRVHNR